LHRLSSSFILGYHGCDRSVAERLLTGIPFNASENEWDWLGSGAYFWEANPLRGLEFAHELQRWRKDKENAVADPYVVGAVVDLGFCLDLTSSTGIRAVLSAHADFLSYCSSAKVEVPQNTGGPDSLFRTLDCAVINHLHKVRDKAGLAPFESVKGVFIEGGPIYDGSGFNKKTHIQLCIRNLGCIKGVFRVPDDQLQP
jgi:hypothetical protein